MAAAEEQPDRDCEEQDREDTARRYRRLLILGSGVISMMRDVKVKATSSKSKATQPRAASSRILAMSR